MIEKKNVKKLAWVAVALVIMVLSMTVVSKAASNPENHKKTIEALDEKKADILKLTATSAAASTAIAAIPGDATTPIANKLTDLTSYFLIILVVIFLEKYFLTISGLVTCRILIPLSCVLIMMFIWKKKDKAASVAAKLTIFGLCCMLLVPASTWATGFIENTYNVSIEKNLEEAEETADALNSNADKLSLIHI